MAETMIIDDKQDTGARTSIKMTRSMGEDAGFIILLDVMEAIEKSTINLSYSRWQWFFANIWNDPFWKKVMSKVVTWAKNDKLNLNKNGYFLDLVFEKTALEFNIEVKTGEHPVYRQSFRELITKERPKPEIEKPMTVEDLFP